uniref:NADH-ubiquinone oxidoreductase chain 1 n=1 Tax=Levensteiniella iris TaxID=2153341 RepID=A0A343W674_9ANNE|nr:NADH dehydrogenase subunit 1 [Levensteiniella iris]
MTYTPFINIIITLICALLAMAFFTLLERKFLGYAQIRKGPNKVSISGIPQPLADALKLLSKELIKPTLSNLPPFLMSPLSALFLALLLWALYPSDFPTHFFTFGILFILAISSLNVYTSLIAGWASNSKYALMGALRNMAQTVSYEISLALILLTILLLTLSFDLSTIHSSLWSWPLLILFPSFLTWFASILAETNRSPFDLAEGESELVSGFNTEYSGGAFTLIFMAEYTNIIFMSLFTALLFFGSLPWLVINSTWLMIKTLLMATIILWIRASVPRMRYDRLMSLTWKMFLPYSLGALTAMASWYPFYL